MPKIRLKSLMFEQPPFRKLGSMRIDFSERVTLIAGHNGIGKSTILGLVANGSGIRDAKLQSYLNRAYQAFLNDIVHLDFEREFNAFKSSGAALPTPYLEYDVDGDELIKKCSTTIREGESLRVVPRTDPHKPFISTSGTVKVGRDAKVPLPTLYLGMTRMLPVGESNPDWVVNDPDSQMHADDITFIESFVNQVIGGATSATGTHTITTQTIKGTGKTAKHPEYGHSPKCISLGQDSLSAIATAVASFQKLKREMPNYPGGLLVIDELDAGFHPHAQAKLASQLKKAARRLDLQIIATTHSMSLIEAVHGEEDGEGREKSPDSIVYLVDTTIPRVAKGYGIEDIRRDMQLTPPAIEQPPKSRSLKLYVEDPEAHFLLGKILTPKLKRRIKYEAGVNVTPISLSLGCDNLMGLHKYDPHFKTVLIAVDADASLKGQGKVTNILKLPGGKDGSGKGLSPERTLHGFVGTLAKNNPEYPLARAALAESKVSSDYLREHLLDGDSNVDDRKAAKKWFNKRKALIQDWKLAELWLQEHQVQVTKFENELVAAAVANARYAL